MGSFEQAQVTRLTALLHALAADPRLPVEVQDAAVEPVADAVSALRLGGRVALMLEEARDLADDANKRLRAALLEVMLEVGAVSIALPHHTMVQADGSAGAAITDPGLLPPDLMRQPPPVPDKAAITKRLRAGQPVPGATLTNGAPYLSIRAKKD